MLRTAIKPTTLKRLALAALAALALTVHGASVAQDHSGLYTAAEIDADAQRLEGRLRELLAVLQDHALTAEENAALDGLLLEFPRPREGDPALSFYAYTDFGEKVVVLPLMSLKMLEDVTTAYAYLLSQGFTAGSIDLYFTMIGRTDPSSFPGGRYPAMLPALGVPADAWRHPPVDETSLRLRNEAFAFVLGHELGHIVLKHRGYDAVSTEQALADEIAADQFALALLERTDTPTTGAALFFIAQAYSLPNRGQFDTDAAWTTFLREKGTHPLTTERIAAFARSAGRLAATREPAEQAFWRFAETGLTATVELLEDVDLQRCMAIVRDQAPMSALAPKRQEPLEMFLDLCT